MALSRSTLNCVMLAPADAALSPSHVAVVIEDSRADEATTVAGAGAPEPQPPPLPESPTREPDAQPAAIDFTDNGQAGQNSIQAAANFPEGLAWPAGALPAPQDAAAAPQGEDAAAMEGEDVAAPAAAIAPGIITADRNGTAAAPPPDPGGKAQQPLPQEDFFAATAEMDEICKDLPAGGEGSNYKGALRAVWSTRTHWW